MEEESQVLIRLNSLMKSGYRIYERASQEVEDAVWLKHPAYKRTERPELILYSDGLIVSGRSHTENTELRIPHNENNEFRKFLANVPQPTLWEKSENTRINVSVWVVLIGSYFIISSVIRYAAS